MSVVTGKHVLFIGDETDQVHDIEKELISLGARVTSTSCSQASVTHLQSDQIDLVFLNHLHNGGSCVSLLNTLRKSRVYRALPIFALVENDAKSIEEALDLGAADYFTNDETVGDIMQKVALVLGEPDTSSRSVIDIQERQKPVGKKGIKVYVVEDDPLLSNLLSMRMSQAKFQYVIDVTGESCAEQIIEFKPDVVILDLTLPGCSGLDILAELRATEATKHVPVIIFSNRDSAEDKERAKSLGANAFYIKAMTDLSELMESIERLV